MNATSVPSLRIVLVALFVGTVVTQILLPQMSHELGGQFEETAHLVVPYAVVGILAVACAQIALIMIWKLLGLVASNAIFMLQSLRWVNVIIGCGVAAALLVVSVPVHLLFVVGVGGPGGLVFLVGSVVGGIAFVLLMSFMRDLLRTAIADRSELEEVI